MRDTATGGCSRASLPPRRISTPATAGSSPRSPRAGTSSLTRRSSREALERRPDATLDEVGAGCRHARPRADRSAARRPLGGQGARLVATAAARARRPPARSRRLAVPRRREGRRTSARAALPLPARERRSHAAARRCRIMAGTGSLGTTLDDAAGEAFDKGARLLGLGYPGGAAIDRAGRHRAIRRRFAFPVARVPGLDFSFSGLKTALLYAVRDLGAGELERRRADLAASYQRAIVRALVERVRCEAAEQYGRDAHRGRRRCRRELRATCSGSRASGAVPAPLRAVHRQRRDDRLCRKVCTGQSCSPTILSWMRMPRRTERTRRSARGRRCWPPLADAVPAGGSRRPDSARRRPQAWRSAFERRRRSRWASG